MFTLSFVRDDGFEIKLDSNVGAPDDQAGFRRFIIGRKTPGITDSRVSREHLMVKYNLESGKVYVRLLGQNASYVERLEMTQLSKNHDYSVSNGDTVWLLNNSMQFTVKLDLDLEETDAESDAGKGGGSGTTPPKSEKTEKNKPKLVDGKEVCMYGAACYRKNPEHRAKFWHPGEEREKGGKTGEKRKSEEQKEEGKKDAKRKNTLGSESVKSPSQEIASLSFANDDKDEIASNHKKDGAPAASSDSDFIPLEPLDREICFAFPSIGTKEGKLDVNKAVEAFSTAARAFFDKLGPRNMNVYLVDDDAGVLDLFAKALEDEPRFSTLNSKSLARMKTESNVTCSVVAVETNWRLKPESTSLSRDLHARSGPGLLDELKRAVTKPLKVGSSCAVKVPLSSELRKEEGVEHVIYVVGPNMNPLRPDPIKEEDKALKLLQECYLAMFETFAKVSDIDIGSLSNGIEAGSSGKKGNAFDMLMGARKKQDIPPVSPAKRNPYSWDNALLKYIEAPEKHSEVVHSYDDRFVVVNDVYPKAAKHFLVMPREKIASITDLRKEHLPLLDAMKTKADELVKTFHEHKFLVGFHSVPSMKQLHLHVISDDFVSATLRTKKHWNSFTTRFFLNFMYVRQEISEKGRLEIDKQEYEELLKGPLVCHKCAKEYPGMRDLKMHLERHVS
ncbi:hypothetical protein HDU96_002827 [Phlyctochytrium bullatum]|nr:hypothetical protein HDU96_002827 [Phlyctochytrium bullatum]